MLNCYYAHAEQDDGAQVTPASLRCRKGCAGAVRAAAAGLQALPPQARTRPACAAVSARRPA